MKNPTSTMDSVMDAVALFHAGKRDEARARFAELWPVVEQGADALARCTLAHFMADLQDDPHEELLWDRRALAAADALTDARMTAHHPSMALRAFYPSLHLNVADAYRRTGDIESAREYLQLAQTAAAVLGDDGYSVTIRRGIARLAERLGA